MIGLNLQNPGFVGSLLLAGGFKLDSSFNATSAAGGSLYDAISLRYSSNSGKVLVSQFDTLYRYNSDGTRDNAYAALTGLSTPITSIHEETTTGKVLVQFGNNIITRLLPDGGYDSSFTSIMSMINTIYAWKKLAYGYNKVSSYKILVVGNYLGEGIRLKRYNEDGTLDNTFTPIAFNGPVYTIEEFVDISLGSFEYTVFLGGDFSTVGPGGLSFGKIVQIKESGVIWEHAIARNTGFEGAGVVRRITANQVNLYGTANSKTQLYISTTAISYNGQSVNALCQIDGTTGALNTSFNQSLSLGTGDAPTIVKIEFDLFSDKGIIINYGYNVLKRLTMNGDLDPNVKPLVFDSDIMAITVLPDLRILVGGQFTQLNGTSKPSLIRLIDVTS